MKFSGTVSNGPVNKWLFFGGGAIGITDLGMDWDTDPGPYRDTGKTCFGGGMLRLKLLLVFHA